MRTLGIDLSADPAKTAACVVDWVDGTTGFLPRPVTDYMVVEAIKQADMAAVDVPLGWPDSFIDALIAHRDGRAWPQASFTPPADRLPLRFRATDFEVQADGARPLSVSTDRLGVAAMRGARIQHLLREAGIPVDRSGLTGRLIEAYPAASLRAWRLPSSGYKGPTKIAALRDLTSAMSQRCGVHAPAFTACLERCDDHDLDAVVCALVARASLLGLTRGPDPTELESAQREGWIHLPTVGLEAITSSHAST